MQPNQFNSDSEKLLAELVVQVSNISSEMAQLRSIISGSPNFVEGWAAGKDAAVALRNEGVKSAKHLQSIRLKAQNEEPRSAA